MGLRDRLKTKLKDTVNRLSGEYSAAAPEEIIPYERNVTPTDDVQVVRARLKRPRDKNSKGGDDQD
jgi:hypothetical protein